MPMRYTDAVLLSEGPNLFRPKEDDEDTHDYRMAFADFMEDKDPLEAGEIRLGKPWNEWTRMEIAYWLLDHHGIWEWGHRFNSPLANRWFKVYGYLMAKCRVVQSRESGAVTSAPTEMLTQRGTKADDEFAPPHRDTHWRGGVLVNAPRGFEEAIAKRSKVGPKGRGHHVIRHFDEAGDSQVKQIVISEEEPEAEPESVVPLRLSDVPKRLKE